MDARVFARPARAIMNVLYCVTRGRIEFISGARVTFCGRGIRPE